MYMHNMKYTEHSICFEQSSLTEVKSWVTTGRKKEIIAYINQMPAHFLCFYGMNFNRIFEVLLDTLKIDSHRMEIINLDLSAEGQIIFLFPVKCSLLQSQCKLFMLS